MTTMKNTRKKINNKNNNKINKGKNKEKTVYGLLFFKLDKTGRTDQYVLAYGNKMSVQLYKEEFNLKEEVKIYKTQGWLVRRIERVKHELGERVHLLHVK